MVVRCLGWYFWGELNDRKAEVARALLRAATAIVPTLGAKAPNLALWF